MLIEMAHNGTHGPLQVQHKLLCTWKWESCCGITSPITSLSRCQCGTRWDSVGWLPGISRHAFGQLAIFTNLQKSLDNQPGKNLKNPKSLCQWMSGSTSQNLSKKHIAGCCIWPCLNQAQGGLAYMLWSLQSNHDRLDPERHSRTPNLPGLLPRGRPLWGQ